jgi:hypothetical protein
VNLFRNLLSRPGKSRTPAAKRVRPRLETLEDRTVPSSARVVPLADAVDGVTTFHRLQDALNVATSSGDVVTIAAGSTADLSPVTVTSSGITITGDPNIPGSILPSYDIVLDASRVTLTRLNLGSVTINADSSADAITRSTVNTITAAGSPAGVGNLTIDQNSVTGYISVVGSAGVGLLNVRVTNNTFNSLVPASQAPLLNVQNANNAVITNNVFTGDGPAPQVGILVSGGLNNFVAGNTVHLNGADLNTIDIEVQNPGGVMTSAAVRNNTLTTGGGRGLSLVSFNDATLQVLVEGNDFHTNAVGVDYLGANTGPIASDLGGGGNSLGGSLGGNNFRDFSGPASADHAAIVLRNVGPNSVLAARFNLFDAAESPPNLVAVTGAGTVDVSQALSQQRAFVQALYNDLLGRSGTLAELDSWVAVLMAGGASSETNVVNGILRSDESLGRIVDQYYLQYLGRASDFAGKMAWVAQIKAGMTLEQVQAGFISSAEFLANNNTDYVQGLYRNFLNRTGGASELAYWYGRLPALGLTGVALAFTQSQESHNDALTHIFNAFLHRNPSAGDMSYWSAQAGDLLTVEANLLGSGEFGVRG